MIVKYPLSVWDIQSGTSLRDAAAPSGEWHHQLFHASRALAFARSRLTGTRGEVIEISESPSARRSKLRSTRCAPLWKTRPS